MVELNTILIEVEAVFNSRPLTYRYVDINDASPLTPSHFLCGHRLLTLPDTRVSVKESVRLAAQKAIHRIQQQSEMNT